MKILVINAGSSSMKYQLIDMSNEAVIAKGNCERIGNGGIIGHKTNTGFSLDLEVTLPTHAEAFAEVLKLLTADENKVINDVSEIDAVGYRVVHGGEKFSASVLITEDVMKVIDEISSLAPLHNPPVLSAIKASKVVFGEKTPMVAVFDTAFHQTMPSKAYMYGAPYEYYEKFGVRRYGFHGTSHRFISARLNEIVGRNDMKVVTCHLGNGSSITAINAGKSVDTSMGLTPNDGIIMGTRSGSVDPGMLALICEKGNMDINAATSLLQKASGLEGISGIGSDMRDLHAAVDAGNKRAELAVDMLCYQIKRYIGAYAAAMGGLDAVVFTGGIGENDGLVRELVCSDFEYMGIKFDAAKNEQASRKDACFSADDSKVSLWVLPTNEELLIARDTLEIISAK